MVVILLVALAAAFVVSLVAALLALVIFPRFRSGEHKPGVFRPDQSSGSMRAIVVTGRRRKRAQPRSSELPLVGGAAMVAAIWAVSIGGGIWLNLTSEQWTLLGIILGALLGFAAVGFLDDWRKVYGGQGISELAKLVGVVFVSLVAAVALNRLVPSARFAYPPYADVPVLGNLLRNTHYIWVIFFILMTVMVSSTTSLAVDFTDGLDGLAGGTLISAALAFAVIILSLQGNQNWPAVLLLVAMVGALLGFLPLNWPSPFKRGEDRGRRRARLIMGDTGSLALGGTLALVTVITRYELLLIVVGGIFLLEGISALVSARILVKFFRRFLYLPRFGNEPYAHTEFPLPFLATPMHHHFDLLGWDRQRLVYAAWTLGAALGALGVASTIAPFTWERYLARLVALTVLIAVWQMGPWTRYYFIGPQSQGLLALYYGFPYHLFGRRLYARVDTVSVGVAALETPVERLGLWQRTNVYDARGSLGYVCYRAGALEDAVRVWSKIPPRNLEVRPQIRELLIEARHRHALEADGFMDAELAPPAPRSPVDTQPSTFEPRWDGPADQDEPSPFSPGAFEPALQMAVPTDSLPFAPESEQVDPPPFETAPPTTVQDSYFADVAPTWEQADPEPSAWILLDETPDSTEGDVGQEEPEPSVAWSPPEPATPAAGTEPSWAPQAPGGLRTPRLQPVNPAVEGAPSAAYTPPVWNGAGWNGPNMGITELPDADHPDDPTGATEPPRRW
jgi:UDP-N-acetylmuramyl pentapeptide phosphotransferase/UDP-N-acetylglucosamine-1-phosphate transferase